MFKTYGNGKLIDVIYKMYGKDISQNLVEVNFEEENIKITGYIGNTTIAMDSRKSQIFFLNKRFIKNQILYNSCDQAFKGDTGIGKFGFAIINIQMPANMYDVNIHPTKKEVKFKDESQIYGIVYRAIKNSILSKEFLGNNTKEENSTYIKNEYNFLTNHFIMHKDNIIQTENNEDDIIKREEKRKIDYKFIGISFKTYIIIQIEDQIYFIDQHAAHERILYEKIRDNYKKNISNNTQMMIAPDVIELSNKEIEFVKENLELIKSTGFDIEPFGEKTIKINGVPDLDYKHKIDNKKLFFDILDEMTTNCRSTAKDIEERFIATVACKAAVKAGMTLTEREVDYLIQNLLTLKNPYTCPHGRPTNICFSRDDLFNKK